MGEAPDEKKGGPKPAKEDPERGPRAAAPGLDEEEPRVLEGLPGSMLAMLSRTEIDVQIATAKRFPRSLQTFRQEVLTMATLDEETAGSMFYVLKRAGKTIEGPSVRLAEIAGSAWGNLRYGARTVDVDEKFVTAQGAAYDLEKNNACTIEVKRRITDRNNRRYSDDMITTTANAAMSIALRNAIFKVVPFSYVRSTYEEAKKVSLGKGLTMEARRQRALDWFAQHGATPEQVLKLLGKRGVEDLAVEDLVTLQGIRTAITDGETTMEQVLSDLEPSKNAVEIPPALRALVEQLGWTRGKCEMWLARQGEVEEAELVRRLEAERPKPATPEPSAALEEPAPLGRDLLPRDEQPRLL